MHFAELKWIDNCKVRSCKDPVKLKWIDHLGTICSAIFLTVSPAHQPPMFTLPGWMPRKVLESCQQQFRTRLFTRGEMRAPSSHHHADLRTDECQVPRGRLGKSPPPPSTAPFMPFCCIMMQTNNNFLI